jgi:hypothetical protein
MGGDGSYEFLVCNNQSVDHSLGSLFYPRHTRRHVPLLPVLPPEDSALRGGHS